MWGGVEAVEAITICDDSPTGGQVRLDVWSLDGGWQTAAVLQDTQSGTRWTESGTGGAQGFHAVPERAVGAELASVRDRDSVEGACAGWVGLCQIRYRQVPYRTVSSGRGQAVQTVRA